METQKFFFLNPKMCLREVERRVHANKCMYVWTDERTSTFLDLEQETNIDAIFDGKQQLAPFNYVIMLLCLLLLW